MRITSDSEKLSNITYRILKKFINKTPFRIVHIGAYIRFLYLERNLRKLPIEEFQYILDAGCGNGQYAIQIACEYPQIQLIAVDIMNDRFPKIHPSNIIFKICDLRSLKENNKFKFIYSIDVLEHIPNNIEIIKIFYNALKENGYLFIHIPYDKGHGRIFPEKYFREFDKWALEEHIGEQYSLNEMISILQRIGFIIVHAEYTFGYIGQFAWELDRITDNKLFAKILLMPLLKFLGEISVRISHRTGNVLVLIQKIEDT